MSTAKRLRQRQAEAHTTSPPPASKRIKSSHVPSKPGLDFLVDEDARAGKQLSAKLTNGVPRSKANRVDDSHAVVTRDEPESDSEDEEEADVPVKKPSADEIIEISSAEYSSEYEDDEEEEEVAPGASLVNGHATGTEQDQSVPGASQEEDLNMEDAEPAEEPTFGEQLQARHPDTIDVQKSLQKDIDANGALVSGGDRRVTQPPTAGSLGTVLTQALKTNDKDLLESCFAMTDVNAIRATIQRQQSQQIATLLQRLAERIHKRPGRAGKLMIWIQWSLVTHGAYLANQPALMKELKSLAQVTRERANGLQPLLHLKGKLDLLSAQLEARRNMQAASRTANDEDDEDGVLYIEGQEREWSSDEEAEVHQSAKRGKRTAKNLEQVITGGSGEESEDEDDDVPNGFINGIEDDSSVDGDEDNERNGFLDDEAEEASDDESSDEEAESNASSMDEDESSDDDESEVGGAAKPQTLNRKR